MVMRRVSPPDTLGRILMCRSWGSALTRGILRLCGLLRLPLPRYLQHDDRFGPGREGLFVEIRLG